MPDNSHRYQLYEPVLFLHSSGASQGAGCSEFHSTHGGFNGPFKEVEIEARAQEGRACKDKAPLGNRQQPREEGQARRCQAAWPAGSEAQDGEESEEGSAQEVGAQSGAEGRRQGPGKSAEHDADVLRADAAAIAATDGAEACGTADVASAATPGGAAITAAAVDAVFRLELVVDLLGN